ncbi:MAG: putative NTPase family [Acidobacteria bacterium]|nr:putative NTPase family [Acidobacteriota bacterium]
MDHLTTDLAAKVAVNAFTEIFKSCYHGLKDSLDWIKGKNDERDFFGFAARRYTEQIEERYGTMRIFGMSESIPIRNIYTRVNVLEKITSQQRETVEDLHRWFQENPTSFGLKRSTKAGIEVVNKTPRIILLGKPGAGKTTFLKYIALQAADGSLRRKVLPVFVQLKHLADSKKSFKDFIVQEFEVCQFPQPQPFLNHMLDLGKCLLLLDGLDEVPKAREAEVVRDIEQLARDFPRTRFIISCRIAAFNYVFEKFTYVEIADFDANQIQRFIENWFTEERKASLCWSELTKFPRIMDLAAIPLLLTLLCLAFDQTMSFPKNRAELYEEALDALLKKWDASRGVKREDLYKDLTIRKKESLFSRIAAKTFQNDEHFFAQRTLTHHIGQFIRNLPQIKMGALEIDSEDILKSIEAQHGLFVERARGIYSFSHLTFQEYFTAKYMVDNASRGSMRRMVEEHFADKRWREVFLMTAGMLDQADDFLMMIIDKADVLAVGRLAFILQPVRARVANQNVFFKTLNISVELAKVLCLGRTIELLAGSQHNTSNHGQISVVSKRILEVLRSLTDLYTTAFGSTLHTAIDKADDLLAVSTLYADAAASVFGHAYREILNEQLTMEGDSLKEINRVLIKDTSGYLLNLLVTLLSVYQIPLECLNNGCYVSRDARKNVLKECLIVIRQADWANI